LQTRSGDFFCRVTQSFLSLRACSPSWQSGHDCFMFLLAKPALIYCRRLSFSPCCFWLTPRERLGYIVGEDFWFCQHLYPIFRSLFYRVLPPGPLFGGGKGLQLCLVTGAEVAALVRQDLGTSSFLGFTFASSLVRSTLHTPDALWVV